MEEIRISAIILTKNEEKNIERCLTSLDFCDERIVIDDGSTDKTVEIAKKHATTVVEHPLNNDFTTQRNYGLSIANGEWILYVDADEEVSKELRYELVHLLQEGKLTKKAYYIPRKDVWWGKELKYGEVLEARKLGFIRLVKKNSGHWTGKVHERYAIKSIVGRLRHHLNHYPHPTLKDFISEVNMYSSIRAKELQSQGKRVRTSGIILYPLGKFLLNYIVRLGFLDGVPGFAYSFLMSFHSFLVRAKLYQYTHYG